VTEDSDRVAEDTGHRQVLVVHMGWADCWRERCEVLALHAAVLRHNVAVLHNPAATHHITYNCTQHMCTTIIYNKSSCEDPLKCFHSYEPNCGKIPYLAMLKSLSLFLKFLYLDPVFQNLITTNHLF